MNITYKLGGFLVSSDEDDCERLSFASVHITFELGKSSRLVSVHIAASG